MPCCEIQVNVFVKQQMTKNELNDVETVDVVWDALMKSVEWPRKVEQCEEQAIKQVKEWGKILTAAATSPRAEIALLNKVQVYCYEDTRITKVFAKLVTLLYQLDALTENAIVYWQSHGSSAKGKGPSEGMEGRDGRTGWKEGGGVLTEPTLPFPSCPALPALPFLPFPSLPALPALSFPPCPSRPALPALPGLPCSPCPSLPALPLHFFPRSLRFFPSRLRQAAGAVRGLAAAGGGGVGL